MALSFQARTSSTKSQITGIEKGTYAPYTVDGGTKKIQHELKIGDFYCADGTLIKADQDLESEDKTKNHWGHLIK